MTLLTNQTQPTKSFICQIFIAHHYMHPVNSADTGMSKTKKYPHPQEL